MYHHNDALSLSLSHTRARTTIVKYSISCDYIWPYFPLLSPPIITISTSISKLSLSQSSHSLNSENEGMLIISIQQLLQTIHFFSLLFQTFLYDYEIWTEIGKVSLYYYERMNVWLMNSLEWSRRRRYFYLWSPRCCRKKKIYIKTTTTTMLGLNRRRRRKKLEMKKRVKCGGGGGSSSLTISLQHVDIYIDTHTQQEDNNGHSKSRINRHDHHRIQPHCHITLPVPLYQSLIVFFSLNFKKPKQTWRGHCILYSLSLSLSLTIYISTM